MPDAIQTVPIDEAARNGRFHLLFGGGEFAVARWADDRWIFSNGVELHFNPTAYRPPEEEQAA